MSPEQARGDEISAASDQFALAVTAYEALSGGILPWPGQSVVEVVAAILRDDPDPLRRHVPSIPGAIEAVLGRAFAKEPRDRWPDLASLADALEHAAKDLPAPAPPPPSPDPVPAPAEVDESKVADSAPLAAQPQSSSSSELEMPPPSSLRPNPKRRRVLAAVAIFVLLFAGAYAMYAETAASPTTPSPM
jgi:serine/threonine-protein kinase